MNLLVLVLLAQSQVQAKVETPREPPRWEVFMGVQGGVRPDTLGGGGGGLHAIRV